MRILKYDYSNKIITYIFTPLIMSLFITKRINFNVAYLIFSIQLLIFLTSINKKNIKVSSSNRISIILLYLIFFFAVLSSLFSSFQLDSLRTSIFVFATSIMLYLLTMFDDNPIKTFLRLQVFNVYMGAFVSLYGIGLLLLGGLEYKYGARVLSLSFGGLDLYQVIMGMPPLYRISSIASNPNTLGIILMFSQLSTIFLFKVKKLSRSKFVFLYLCQITALILSQSRAAIIASIVMVILITFFTTKSKLKYVISVLTITVIFLFLLIILNPDLTAILRFDEGLSGREQAWKIIIDRITQNPFIGVGFGVSSEAYLETLGIKAHNVYLNTIIEIGLIGFIFFALVWIQVLFKTLINFKRKNHTVRLINVMVFSMMFSLLLHQLVENKLLVYDYVMFLWVYNIAVIASINSRNLFEIEKNEN